MSKRIKMIATAMMILGCLLAVMNISVKATAEEVTPSVIEVKPTPTPSASASKKLTKAEKRKLIKSFTKDIKLKDTYTHKGTYVHYINNMQGAKLTNANSVSRKRMLVTTKGNKITMTVKKAGKVRFKLQYKGRNVYFNREVKLASNSSWEVNCRQVVLNKVGDKHKVGLIGVSNKERSRVKFSTNNRKVATVDRNGNIIAKGKGSCKVTVKIGNKKVKIGVIVKSGATAKNGATASVSLGSGASIKSETPKATPKPKTTPKPKASNNNNKNNKVKADEEAKVKENKVKASNANKKNNNNNNSNNNNKNTSKNNKNTKSSSKSSNNTKNKQVNSNKKVNSMLDGVDVFDGGDTTMKKLNKEVKNMSEEEKAMGRRITTG